MFSFCYLQLLLYHTHLFLVPVAGGGSQCVVAATARRSMTCRTRPLCTRKASCCDVLTCGRCCNMI